MPKEMILPYQFDAVAVSQAGTSFTSPMPFKSCSGFAWVKLVSSAGSIAVSYQASDNKEGPFIDPVDEDNAAVGIIVSSGTPMTASTRWVSCAAIMAPWIRMKIIEQDVASTSVSATVFFQESN